MARTGDADGAARTLPGPVRDSTARDSTARDSTARDNTGRDDAVRDDAVRDDPAPGHGGPRSAGTRRAILDAARSAFAAHGYDQTTIRAVAAAAGVDASMVMRYFGSKAGLFTAAATADLLIPDLAATPAAGRGEVLARYLVERWEDDDRDELILLLRTAVNSEAVAAQLQATLGQLVTGPIAALGVPDAAERGAFIGAQLLGLALCRYILRQEPLAALPAADVIAAVAPSVQRYLDDPVPGGGRRGPAPGPAGRG